MVDVIKSPRPNKVGGFYFYPGSHGHVEVTATSVGLTSTDAGSIPVVSTTRRLEGYGWQANDPGLQKRAIDVACF